MKDCNWGGKQGGLGGAFAPLVCMLKEALAVFVTLKQRRNAETKTTDRDNHK